MTNKIDKLVERVEARIFASTTQGNMNDKTAQLLMDCKTQLLEDKKALEKIADHFDMDGYGDDAWKDLALEMADVAKTALGIEG